MYVFSDQEWNSGKTGNKEDSFLKWKINMHIEFMIAWKEILDFNVWFYYLLPQGKALIIHTKC